jgi:RNA polymerase sigma-70 factor (ECF subfamily)
VDHEDAKRQFEARVMPHLDAGYQTARWLTKSATEAEDVVQEAALRAFRFLSGLRDQSARGWFLTIVRRVAFDRRAKATGVIGLTEAFGEEGEISASDPTYYGASPPSAEAALIAKAEADEVRSALNELPEGLRMILILREVEGLSYDEIAKELTIPIGTVMSRLSRARVQLRSILVARRSP